MMNSTTLTCDLHSHSVISDGSFSPREVILKAIEAGVGILAITDHNALPLDFSALQEEFAGKITLLRGCEMSCTHTLSTGKKVELHVVVLNYDEPAPALQQIAQRHQNKDRKTYITSILNALEKKGIQIGDYEFLVQKYSNTKHIGRMTIAKEMLLRGYVSNIDEAFDIYLGSHGQRQAYVPNPIVYSDLEAVINASLHDHGIPILAHLFYYNTLTQAEQHELLQTFRRLTGPVGAMEVEYAKYSAEQRKTLRELARQYDLGESAGSDFHGQSEEETLFHNFPGDIALRLLERQQAAYGAVKGGVAK